MCSGVFELSEKILNCWEIKGCGREPDGEKVDHHGVCPAATDISYNGSNHGVCGGRICWAIAGTFCNNLIQGLFAEKIESCVSCEVFQQVTTEEGDNFMMYLEQNQVVPLSDVPPDYSDDK